MADYTPVYQPGSAQSHTVGATAVLGGRLVEVGATATVVPAGAASTKVVGVAAFSAATGARVTVHTLPGQVHEVTAVGAITAGDGVIAAADGRVATIGAGTFQQLVGVALTTCADAGTCRFVGR